MSETQAHLNHSLAQSVELICPGCGQAFQADVWLIVDAAERPDLLAQIMDETIHLARCPHCGVPQPLDAPLLFHDAAHQLLIFAEPEQSAPARVQQVARELGQHLIATIPVNERATYLTSAHTVPGIHGLQHALAGDADAEGDAFSHALQALMEATSSLQVRAVATQYPLLDTAEAQAQLQDYVQQLHDAGHADLADALAQRIEALQASQPHPTLQFIQALLDAETVEQRHALLVSRPQDVTPEVPTILAALADQAQRRHLEPVARDMLVIRDEVLRSLGQDLPVTPSA